MIRAYKPQPKRSYGYGILSVKSASWMAGGGLFITPAIVQLTSNPDLGKAGSGGLLFAGALFGVLLVSFLTHINWAMHEGAWRHDHVVAQTRLRMETDWACPNDTDELEAAQRKFKRDKIWANISFYVSYIFVLLFFFLFMFACLTLYQALGIGI